MLRPRAHTARLAAAPGLPRVIQRKHRRRKRPLMPIFGKRQNRKAGLNIEKREKWFSAMWMVTAIRMRWPNTLLKGWAAVTVLRKCWLFLPIKKAFIVLRLKKQSAENPPTELPI